LEKAAGGKITLEATTINRLADLSHKAASKTADKWNRRVQEIPESALGGTGISKDPIAIAPLETPKPAANLPKSKSFKLDGGGSVIGQLESDSGRYYVIRGGKKMYIEE
jgi:hypothetical protein